MVLSSVLQSVDIPECTVASFILKTISKFGETPALIDPFQDQVLSFNEVKQKSIEFAFKLRQLGVKQGDVVNLALPVNPCTITLMLGVALNKAAIASSNFRDTHGAIAHQINEVKAKVCIIDCSLDNEDLEIQLLYTDKVLYFEDIQLMKITDNGNEALLALNEEWLSSGNADVYEDPFYFLYTSGTTGNSKTAVSTNHAVLTHALNCGSAIRQLPVECCLTVCEPMHRFAFCAIFMYLTQGISHVIVPKLNASQLLRYTLKYKVELLFMSTHSTLADIVQNVIPPKDGFPLKYIFMTGVNCPPNLLRECQEKLEIVASSAWGMTETGFITMGFPKQTPMDSVGKLLPGIQLKVLDVVTGNEVGPGFGGELCLKMANVIKEYYQRPVATSEVLDADGWFKTGDYGRYDQEGFVYIMDRIKDIIKTDGGLAIYPTELEAVLLSHPAVSDAAVVRVPHELYVEAPKAFVVKKSNFAVTQDELVDFCNDKVSKHKWLYGGLEFVDDIPRTGIGKPLKRLLGSSA